MTARNVVFLGTHGQRNIGDELLLETFLWQFGPEHQYTINTYDPTYSSELLGERYTVAWLRTQGDRVRLLRALWNCDCLIFGGGSILKELYATVGRNRYATLAMILAVVTFAKVVARKKIAMFNIGVGPIETKMGARLARLILRQVDTVTVRDHKSYQTCQWVGVDATKVVESVDAVFSTAAGWLRSPQVEIADPVPEAERIHIALNLNFDIANPQNWDHVVTHLAEGFNQLATRYDFTVHLLPMQTGFKAHDDSSVLSAFGQRISGIEVVEHDLATHHDVADLLGRCDLIVGERLHALIIAAIVGTPGLVLAYDVKVTLLVPLL